MENFSELIKEKRVLSGLTQHGLAGKLGVSWMTIWRWENGVGKPKPDALKYWTEKIEDV